MEGRRKRGVSAEQCYLVQNLFKSHFGYVWFRERLVAHRLSMNQSSKSSHDRFRGFYTSSQNFEAWF